MTAVGPGTGASNMAFRSQMCDQWLPARLFRRAFLFSILLAVLAAPVQAQDSASLARELDRLKRDIADLQRTVYAGRQPTAAAVPEDGSQVQVAARQQLRIQALEREMRELTGALEEVRYQVDTIAARVDKLIGDVDFRLQALERRLSGDDPPAVSEAPGGLAYGQTGLTAEQSGDGTTIITSQGAVGPGSQTLTVAEDGELRPGQRLLGQLTQSELESGVAGQQSGGAQAPTPIGPEAVRQQTEQPALPQAAPLQGDIVAQAAPAGRPSTVALPDGTPREQYDYAFDLLRQRDFPAAETALKAFLERNDDGPLAANAMYWLGETHYARENYRDAATVFLDAYTNFPMESKASHSLLKLGMSLGALGKNEQACLTFDELRTKYRDAEPRVLSRADVEAEKLACQ